MPRLKELLKGITAEVYLPLETKITGIAYDSRRIERGNIFVACKGYKDDGKNYVSQVLGKGAVAIVTDEKISNATNTTLPLILVSDTRDALAKLATNFYHNPADKLLLIGVTGTNGKTTITYLLESILATAGQKVGVVGTVNYRLAKKIFPISLTTPESVDLQKILSWMKREKANTVVMEVSSHALVQKRIQGCIFDIAIFTNLTREHLDFHQTMEEYFAAKTKLFTELNTDVKKKFPKFAIINFDCPWGERLINLVKVPVISYGIKKEANFRADEIKLNKNGSFFILQSSEQGRYPVRFPLLGKYNISNALAATSAAYALGINLKKIVHGLERIKPIPGRLERVDLGQSFTVIIDYAHSDDALANVLATLQEICSGRIITVFGCGGDRDRSKRPRMGEVASRLSNFVFITTDNPRSEDPQRIALDIEVGTHRTGKNNYEVILDRYEAIKKALYFAQPDDFVLIAGKGHENYQIFADRTIPFSDKEVARNVLTELKGKWKRS